MTENSTGNSTETASDDSTEDRVVSGMESGVATSVVSGADETFPLLLLTQDFSRLNPYLPDQYQALIPVLSSMITELVELPVDHIVIPNITLHQVYDRLDKKILQRADVVHPVTCTVAKMLLAKKTKGVVFGTYYSMGEGPLRKQFLSNGITLSAPLGRSLDLPIDSFTHLSTPLSIHASSSPTDFERVDQIRRLVYTGKETPYDIKEFNQIVVRYAKKTAVVIACTELSVILDEASLTDNKNIYDMARIQIAEAASLTLSSIR